MPTDKQMAEFCYSMLKQLDLKTIDWNFVAASNGISNGHAARMRFSRFRQQMEGIPASARAPRQKAAASGSAKAKSKAAGKTKSAFRKRCVSELSDCDTNDDEEVPLVRVKAEPIRIVPPSRKIKVEPRVKDESSELSEQDTMEVKPLVRREVKNDPDREWTEANMKTEAI